MLDPEARLSWEQESIKKARAERKDQSFAARAKVGIDIANTVGDILLSIGFWGLTAYLVIQNSGSHDATALAAPAITASGAVFSIRRRLGRAITAFLSEDSPAPTEVAETGGDAS